MSAPPKNLPLVRRDGKRLLWVDSGQYRTRAVLEMLSDVPSHQGLEEAQHLVEMLYGLRPHLMQSLLEDCLSVKTVRLFLRLARRASLPVVDDLDPGRLRTGSDSGYVIVTPAGALKL